MGKASRDKGARTERECVHILQEAGLAAERVPLSGASGGRYRGDVSVPVLGVDRVLEVKCRASGWKQAYAFLADNYGLVIRADREVPLMVMRLDDFAELAITADEERCLSARLTAAVDADRLAMNFPGFGAAYARKVIRE